MTSKDALGAMRKARKTYRPTARHERKSFANYDAGNLSVVGGRLFDKIPIEPYLYAIT